MPHTLDVKRIREVIESCESEIENLTKWEQSFVESISDQYERSGRLSDRQLEILERIYLKI